MVRLSFEDPAAPAAHLFAIETEFREKPLGYRDSVLHHFALFLTLCCREALASGLVMTAPESGATRRPPASVQRLEKLRRFLDSEFARSHPLPELARRVGMTPGSLCRAFRRYTGISISQYLVRRRIQEAMLRLRTTDDKILSIAMACGFNDLSYFNRTFKRLVGRTPGACRSFPGYT
jgi:AraC-like DNA-binding protein